MSNSPSTASNRPIKPKKAILPKSNLIQMFIDSPICENSDDNENTTLINLSEQHCKKQRILPKFTNTDLISHMNDMCTNQETMAGPNKIIATSNLLTSFSTIQNSKSVQVIFIRY